MRRREKARRRLPDFYSSQQYELNHANGEARSKKPTPVKVEELLSQPADDSVVQQRTRTIFDQVNQFVQNFCLTRPGPETKLAMTELAAFEYPGVQKPLGSLLRTASDAHPLIKGSLAHYVVGKITLRASSQETLLPTDLVFLANATTANTNRQG